ncbi:MAG: TolC family protein [Acidobacteriota bacterium]
MRRRRWIVSFFTLMTIAGATARADSPRIAASAAPPVADLVREAIARSPALAALRAQVRASRELEPAAGAPPDPMLEAMLQDVGFPRSTVGKEAMSMAGLELRQDIRYPGKRGAATDVARAETAAREADLAAATARVAAEVRSLYADLYVIDRRGHELHAAQELVEMLAATAAGRYAAGEAEQEAVLKAQLEVSRLGNELDDLTAERAAKMAELGRWLDWPAGATLGEVAALPPVALDAGAVARAADAAPEVLAGEAQVGVAQRRVHQAELDLRPDLTAAAGVGLRGALDPVVTLRLGVELPVWRRRKQEPMLRAAKESLGAAEHELADRRAMARAESTRLLATWSAADRQVTRLREAVVPQSSAALDAARVSYLSGRGDFLTVVDDFNRWLEARVELARREADRYIAWAGIERLVAPGLPENRQGAQP